MGQNFSGVFGKQTEQLIFDWSQMDFCILDIGASGGIVDLQFAVDIKAAFLSGGSFRMASAQRYP